MFGNRSYRTNTATLAEAYSFSPELKETFIEKVGVLGDNFSEFNSGRKTSHHYFAKKLSSPYIVDFIRDGVDARYRREAFNCIADACMESASYNAVSEMATFDTHLNRMLNAARNMKYIPEKQINLLRVYARCCHSPAHSLARVEEGKESPEKA
jgi:hypothetical protein